MLPGEKSHQLLHRYPIGHPPPVHLSAFKVTRWHISLAIVMAAFGLLVSVQWHSQTTLNQTGQQARTDPSASTIRGLEDEQKSLKSAVADLQRRLQDAQQGSSVGKSNLDGLQSELDRQRMLAGLTQLKGPGVKITLDDSTKNPLPEDNPNNYIVHDYELRDIINLLWTAGAEAIAVNGERLTSVSSVFCVGTTILVNDTRMSPPYEISAIGNTNELDDAVNNPASLRKLKTAAKLYGIQMKDAKLKELTLPAFDGALSLRHVTAGGS